MKLKNSKRRLEKKKSRRNEKQSKCRKNFLRESERERGLHLLVQDSYNELKTSTQLKKKKGN
jgi:hypothetical protein